MKVVIFDMYGVINFGSGVSPTVLQALKTLREDGKIVIILSNASFGSADAVSKYAKKGIFKGVHYDDVVTSGQFGYEAIQRGDVPVPGTTMYVFGTANFKRPEDKLPDLFKDSVYSVTEDMEKLILPIAAYHRFTVRTEWILMTLFRNWKNPQT